MRDLIIFVELGGSTRAPVRDWIILCDCITNPLDLSIPQKLNLGGIPTEQAKDLAAQAQGFSNQAHYWAWLRVYVERKRLG